jgi:hypothetical protein
MVMNKEFEKLGNSYWSPQIIHTIWNEAEEGKIPVFGAGYRGRFRGQGFDDIWTDMSEIVRPTRDGIHGREYIATSVDLGRKLPWISDFKRLNLPNSYEIQIPMLLDTTPSGINSRAILLPIIKASHKLGTFAFLDIENSYLDKSPWKEANFIELVLPRKFSISELERVLKKLKSENQTALISLGLTDPSLSKGILKQFKEGRADILNFHADDHGQSFEGNIFICDSIRKLQLDLVKERMREEVTILAKGGIAAAEHVPKIIICGADAAVLDLSLLVAVGCRVCKVCKIEDCPVELEKLGPEIAEQRMINMICAWRDQLLEILSAMGIRDVRRLRGEKGRAMFYEEIERDSFEFIFKGNSPVK